MNASSSRESEPAQESTSDGGGKTMFDKPKFTVSSWSRLKDPRIVRVSRAFGGKDRHSKVCTVRGLKDRRVRLSVPTAIQLYDLQDRLGLNQPSKVVDWLLDVAKDEIDELPPLKIPFGSFGNDVPTIERIENGGSLNWEDFWNPNRSKDVLRETSGIRGDQEEGNNHDHHHGTTFAQPSTVFVKNNDSSPSMPCLLNPNGSFFKWDPSNLSLSQFRSHESLITPSHPQQEAVHDFNMAALASMPPPATQLFSYPQTQSYFQTSSTSSSSRNPLMSSSSDFTPPPLFTLNQGMRPFHLSMNPKFFASQLDHHGNDQPDKGN